MKYLTDSELWHSPRKQKVLRQRLLAFLATIIGIVAICQPSQAQTSTPPEPAKTGLINAQAVVFNPATAKAYTVNTDGDAVDIVNDVTGAIAHVKVGSAPVSIAIDSGNGRAYVANAGDGTVSVIDGNTDTVVATVPVGPHPYSIAADGAAGRVYVSHTFSDQLTIVDAATNQATGIKAGSFDLIAVNPKSGTTYLLGYEGGNLAVLHDSSLADKTSVGMHAWGMALDDATGTLYIARPGDAQVAAIESGSTQPHMLPTGLIPCAVAVNPRTHTLYVVNYGGNSVTAIDTAKRQTVATLPVGKRPEAVTVDSTNNLVYVANTLSDSVTVIDGANDKVLATLKVGIAPYALAIDSSAGKLHVANLGATSFTTIDVSHIRNPSR